MPSANSLALIAPLSGPILPLSQVPDPTFAQKLVGDGIAIDPIDEVLLSPCQGRIGQLHGACHALTVATPEGLEVMMHIGLETVLLKGQGFTPLINHGQEVEVGSPLIAFDASFLAHKALSLLTMMVVVNSEKVDSFLPAKGLAQAGVTRALVLKIKSEGEKSLSSAPQAIITSIPIDIPNPAGLHARPAAVLATRAKKFTSDIKLIKNNREANAKSLVAILGLEVAAHDKVIFSASGNDAQMALDTLVPLTLAGLGDNIHALAPPPKSPPIAVPALIEIPKESLEANVLKGVPASPGLVAGQIFELKILDYNIEENGQGLEIENKKLLKALEEAKKELDTLEDNLRRRSEPDKAAIFAAHRELLDDPELLEGAEQVMKQGKSAALAWNESFTLQAQSLANLKNELLAGRANDIRDVGYRVLSRLAPIKKQRVAPPPGSILIAEDLTPSDTALLDKTKVVGFCTLGGSATSHASILARSMSIAAVAAIDRRALELKDGQEVILDGDKGLLRLNPTESELNEVREKRKKAEVKREKELKEALEPATTIDGRTIKVVANIGGVEEANEVPTLGGDGVGLLRSEFLFLKRASAPSEEEQISMYVAIAKALGPQRDLVARTLDVGGDKPLAYLPMEREVNPFLGIRGLRLNILGEGLFRTQIRALLRAAQFARLHIMFPMVTSKIELIKAKAIVMEEKAALNITDSVKVGVMIEVPAAAILAELLAKEADFFSIGTNDLTQYCLAIDRGHPKLASMADAAHPAVLRLIEKSVRGAHANNKWVGVCGGLAGDVAAVAALIGLGVDELSVSAAAIPSIKGRVRRLTYARCQQLASELLSLATAAEVRERLKSFEQTQLGKEA